MLTLDKHHTDELISEREKSEGFQGPPERGYPLQRQVSNSNAGLHIIFRCLLGLAFALNFFKTVLEMPE